MRSHAPIVCSPVPGTSGEKRAVARVECPGASRTSTAVSPFGNAARTWVGNAFPRRPRSVTDGSPLTWHVRAERLRSTRA